jgi:hypothetical protein
MKQIFHGCEPLDVLLSAAVSELSSRELALSRVDMVTDKNMIKA